MNVSNNVLNVTDLPWSAEGKHTPHIPLGGRIKNSPKAEQTLPNGKDVPMDV